jgi:purine-binding chemotaxis protein CheW
MAEHGARAGAQEAAPAPREAGASSADRGTADGIKVVVFDVGGTAFGIRLADVREIVRVPILTNMPLAPPSLLGLANVRGEVLPVVSLRRLIGLPDAPFLDAARVLVSGARLSAGFAVDRIVDLLTISPESIVAETAGVSGFERDLFEGAIENVAGERALAVFDSGKLQRAHLFGLKSGAGQRARPKPAGVAAPAAAAAPLVNLLSFELERQEYAFALEDVREIIAFPAHMAAVARAETAVLGVVSFRQKLLPLVSLRALLGLPGKATAEGQGKVVVVSLGPGAVGVVADRTREILRIDARLVDPAPPLLARGGGEAEITSICRLEHGRRLVAVLSPDRLFRSDLVRRILSEATAEDESRDGEREGQDVSEEEFVVFHLAGQEFGLPVNVVEQVARVPAKMAKIPKAPAFIEGLINLRGVAVPVIDLRRRFELPVAEPSGRQRILVVAIRGGKAAFVVDDVVGIIRLPDAGIALAPDLSAEQMRLIGRVAAASDRERMVLLVDPGQLLDRAEEQVLAEFQRTEEARTVPSP